MLAGKLEPAAKLAVREVLLEFLKVLFREAQRPQGASELLSAH